VWPVLSPKAVAYAAGKPIETEHFVVGIDAKTGAITRLRNKAMGREWASAKNPVGLFTYQTLSNDDFQRFLNSYLTTKEDGHRRILASRILIDSGEERGMAG